MLTGVAFVPRAPALLPEVGRGLDRELAAVRAACATAIVAVAAPTVVVLAAPALAGERAEPEPAGPLPSSIPSPAAVGRWWVRSTLDVPVAPWTPGGDLPAGPFALLVVGDGSARRSEKAPGYLDPDAEAYDRAVRDALDSGDPARLAALPDGTSVLAAGTDLWHAAAGVLDGGLFEAEVLYDDAPFGVGYLVATWRPRRLRHA